MIITGFCGLQDIIDFSISAILLFFEVYNKDWNM